MVTIFVLPHVRQTQSDEIRIETILSENGANRAYGNCRWQDRIVVWFNNNGIACCQRSEQAGVGVPGRESA